MKNTTPLCPLGKTPLVLNEEGKWECPSCGWNCSRREGEDLTKPKRSQYQEDEYDL